MKISLFSEWLKQNMLSTYPAERKNPNMRFVHEALFDQLEKVAERKGEENKRLKAVLLQIQKITERDLPASEKVDQIWGLCCRVLKVKP